MSGYVTELRKTLFSLATDEMQKKLKEYTAKVPDAMNTQFEERRSKKEAVVRYKLRQTLACTELFPEGNIIMEYNPLFP